MSIYKVPDMLLNVLHLLLQSILTTTLLGKFYHEPHVSDKDIESQRKGFCLKSHNY